MIEKKTRKEEVSKTVSIDFFPLTILISRLLTVQSGTQIFQSRGFQIRDRPRFFDQVGNQTTNASIGNKHFFTK